MDNTYKTKKNIGFHCLVRVTSTWLTFLITFAKHKLISFRSYKDWDILFLTFEGGSQVIISNKDLILRSIMNIVFP